MGAGQKKTHELFPAKRLDNCELASKRRGSDVSQGIYGDGSVAHLPSYTESNRTTQRSRLGIPEMFTTSGKVEFNC